MGNLYITGTKSTPEVAFDAEHHVLSLKGQSYPDNAFKFYEPLCNWADQYLEQLDVQDTVRIDLSFSYVNTSSAKCIMMLLEKFDQAFLAGKKLQMDWHYQVDNEIELECAEEFTEDLHLPFRLIPLKDE